MTDEPDTARDLTDALRPYAQASDARIVVGIADLGDRAGCAVICADDVTPAEVITTVIEAMAQLAEANGVPFAVAEVPNIGGQG